jgi:hypothetical protein
MPIRKMFGRAADFHNFVPFHGAPLDLDMLIAKYRENYVYINDKRIGAA